MSEYIQKLEGCIYPDWDGGYIKNPCHKYDKEGYCIICGKYKKPKKRDKGEDKIQGAA